MPAAVDLGSFAPTDTVSFRFATLDAAGAPAWWGGLALLVRPGGVGAEDGVAVALDSPADGLHGVTVVLPVAADLGGALEPGRHRVVLYGDPIGDEPVQGVTVATFLVS